MFQVVELLGLCDQGAAKNQHANGRGKQGETGKRGLQDLSYAFRLLFAPHYLNAWNRLNSKTLLSLFHTWRRSAVLPKKKSNMLHLKSNLMN